MKLRNGKAYENKGCIIEKCGFDKFDNSPYCYYHLIKMWPETWKVEKVIEEAWAKEGQQRQLQGSVAEKKMCFEALQLLREEFPGTENLSGATIPKPPVKDT